MIENIRSFLQRLASKLGSMPGGHALLPVALLLGFSLTGLLLFLRASAAQPSGPKGPVLAPAKPATPAQPDTKTPGAGRRPQARERSPLPKPPDITFSPAVNAYLKGEFERAIAFFKREVAIKPDDPTAYYYIGNIYYDLGDSRSAERWYIRALERNPKDPLILIGLGSALKENGQLDGALLLFQEALRLDKSKLLYVPSVTDVLRDLYQQAMGDFSQGRLARASFNLERLLEIEPLAIAYYQLGRIAKQQGPAWFKQAEENYNKALAQDPNNPLYHLALGELYYARGEFQQSEAAYTEALKLDPFLHAAHLGLGHAKLAQDKGSEAMEPFMKSVERAADQAGFYLRWGDVFLRAELFDEAITHYQNALAAKSDLSLAMLQLGVSLYKKALYLESNPPEEMAQQESPPDLVSKSLGWLQRALQLNPFSFTGNLYLGKTYIKSGMNEQGILQLRKAQALSPRSSEVHLFLGIGLSQAGIPDEAMRYFLKAVRLNPRDGHAYYSLGIAYMDLDMVRNAADAFLRAARLLPKNQEIFFSLSAAYMTLGDRERAFYFMKRALAMESEYVQKLMAQAADLYGRGFLDAAITAYKRVLSVNPRLAKPHYAIGFLYYLKGLNQRALHFLERGLDLDPTLPPADVASFLVESIRQGRPL